MQADLEAKATLELLTIDDDHHLGQFAVNSSQFDEFSKQIDMMNEDDSQQKVKNKQKPSFSSQNCSPAFHRNKQLANALLPYKQCNLILEKNRRSSTNDNQFMQYKNALNSQQTIVSKKEKFQQEVQNSYRERIKSYDMQQYNNNFDIQLNDKIENKSIYIENTMFTQTSQQLNHKLPAIIGLTNQKKTPKQPPMKEFKLLKNLGNNRYAYQQDKHIKETLIDSQPFYNTLKIITPSQQEDDSFDDDNNKQVQTDSLNNLDGFSTEGTPLPPIIQSSQEFEDITYNKQSNAISDSVIFSPKTQISQAISNRSQSITLTQPTHKTISKMNIIQQTNSQVKSFQPQEQSSQNASIGSKQFTKQNLKDLLLNQSKYSCKQQSILKTTIPTESSQKQISMQDNCISVTENKHNLALLSTSFMQDYSIITKQANRSLSPSKELKMQYQKYKQDTSNKQNSIPSQRRKSIAVLASIPLQFQFNPIPASSISPVSNTATNSKIISKLNKISEQQSKQQIQQLQLQQIEQVQNDEIASFEKLFQLQAIHSSSPACDVVRQCGEYKARSVDRVNRQQYQQFQKLSSPLQSTSPNHFKFPPSAKQAFQNIPSSFVSPFSQLTPLNQLSSLAQIMKGTYQNFSKTPKQIMPQQENIGDPIINTKLPSIKIRNIFQ